MISLVVLKNLMLPMDVVAFYLYRLDTDIYKKSMKDSKYLKHLHKTTKILEQIETIWGHAI